MSFIFTVCGIVGGILIGYFIAEKREENERLSEDQLRAIYRREHQRQLDGQPPEWE